MVIETQNLSRTFGSLNAVDSVSFHVEKGEVFGFLGHNGAGKTTTIRMLNGVLTPTTGNIKVLGYDPSREGSELRRRTGVLTENPSIDERLTARENLKLYADLYDVPQSEVAGRIESLLSEFDLMERIDDRTGGYSKGMKQRLSLARALLHQPELLYLDEPTSGLDPVASRLVHKLIVHLSKDEGRTVFLCTHNLVEAQKLCHRVAVLEHGQIKAIGTPQELAERLGQHLGLELEIDPNDKQKALNLLDAAGFIEETSLEDTGILKVSGVGRAGTPQLIKDLAGGGVNIYRVTQQEASLEDIYFALHDESEAQRS